MHHSIEEMARDYLKEILTITNQQKFYLLGYCFSTAVCLEIARIAKKHDLDIELVIIDSGALLWYLRQGRLDRIKYQILKFGKKILKGDWQGISKITRKRIEQINVKFRVNKDNHFEEVVKESENHPNHHLERMNLNLERLYKKYHWDSFQTKVHLIRSSEFANLHEKDYHINVWKNLSNNELATYQVDGKHDTIFNGNSVVEMARTIEKIIEYEIE